MTTRQRAGSRGYFESLEAVSALPRLVRVSATVSENQPTHQFDVFAYAQFGEQDIVGADSHYALKLRNCFMLVGVEECKVLEGSAYRYHLQDSAFTEVAEATAEYQASSNSALEFKGGVAADHGGARGSVAAGISAAAQQKSTVATKHETTSKPTIKLIEAVPGGWRVGDVIRGDPRHASGNLDGPYFVEKEPTTPLCRIELVSNWKRATINLVVTARYGALSVYVVEPGKPPRPDSAEAHRVDVTRVLKERIAGIAVAKELKTKLRGSKIPVSDGEHVLAFHTIVAAKSGRAARKKPPKKRPAP